MTNTFNRFSFRIVVYSRRIVFKIIESIITDAIKLYLSRIEDHIKHLFSYQS